MAKTKKKKGIILNSEKESGVDTILKRNDKTDWNIKTLEAASETKIDADKGEGEPLTLRFFDFKANPLAFVERTPTAQEIFNAHLKQIEFELWKDEWKIVPEVPPRFLLAKDKSHYRIVVTAKPVNVLSYKEKPRTLAEIASETLNNPN